MCNRGYGSADVPHRLLKWAIEADSLLLDRAYMLIMIYRSRYGDKRLGRRLESRKEMGLPFLATATSATVNLAEAAE
jgi:hypothetical protein